MLLELCGPRAMAPLQGRNDVHMKFAHIQIDLDRVLSMTY